jgi:nitrate/TMAO reductase-like tetraheme cytochrome c subunit
MKLIRIRQKAASRRFLLIISLLISLVTFFSRCFDHVGNNDPRGELYAGSKTCITCHRSLTDSYTHNNHYRTSSPASTAALTKLVPSSPNRFYFTDSSYVALEGDEHALFQSHVVGGQKKESGSFDIVFGSAEKAQTFGYWRDSTLYELPLTFFAGMNLWANSPGFPVSHARFNRVIISRCFECHASYVNASLVQTGALSVSERLDKNSIVYGIDCERCHGPALQHVRFQRENPAVKTAKYITSIRSLPRQRQMDLCATCHSGNDQSLQRSLFAFVPGDTLSHYYFPGYGERSPEPDVHGKQVQLLQSSLCYQRSEMTCTTCHDPHGGAAGPAGVVGGARTTFVAQCMDCHGQSAHAVAIQKENEQKKRDFNLTGASCIDCHMPLQPSKTIYFNNGAESKNIPYFLRTHKIAIYK